MDIKQVKSKNRVTTHGEVFTAEREVSAMLDLVKQETERIDSRFLEPACGEGNFLAEILRRKLIIVKRKYRKSINDYEKNSVLAVSSIYGVDILLDNVVLCRDRLFDIWNKEYESICKKNVNDDCRKSIRFILERNIVCGNALSLKKVDEKCNDTDEPIVFSEWAFVIGSNLQRSDYRFDKLLEGDIAGREIFQTGKNKKKNISNEQLEMFEESTGLLKIPNDEGEFLKKQIFHYRKVWENVE